MKVFLDSNILFSICWSGKEVSRSWLFFELQRQGHVQLFISNLVHDETSFNLQTKRLESLKLFKQLVTELTLLQDNFGMTAHPQIMRLSLNDRVIFMTALAHGMEYFISGNSCDFSDLYGQRIGTMLNLRPVDFLNSGEYKP
jgi:predicted nucleic acid-binding protein